MRLLGCFGLVATLALSSAGTAASPDDQVMAPIRLMVDSFNNGDMRTAATAVSPDGIVIIDDAPPHVWSGPNAFEAWSKALDAADAAEGNTDDFESYGKPTRMLISADRAYVVLPSIYTFKRKGVAMQEVAQIVYTLRKESTGWLVTGFTWVGTKPTAKRAG